ncbi:hypothetical protein IQ268_22630 [Oculatella sp. LEGE 06141]|uniref:hypothetical protein n=1 Tax=Oculatella sp. LEGE 06141 TaxID=1828648 RepID=UPI001882A26D|nr:hypothetical protein [Oculatella sp. LEGE 06141]MBE9181362.1 hypothetical protein [Oculatella sp. LEGE 06141]
MDDSQDLFKTANYLIRKADHARWHRQQSKIHILRSQLGFTDKQPSRPMACQGCEYYHGIAYGQQRDKRTVLICGFHPYGWQSGDCPDWSGAAKV